MTPGSPPEILRVTVDRPANRLELEFDDGTEGAIDLTDLRRHCPCATCRAQRQRGRPVLPQVHPGGASPSLSDASFVGAWGLGVTWDDGHSTGIYPFEALHEWVRSGAAPMLPDSGLGG